jgi:hypothetical protein
VVWGGPVIDGRYRDLVEVSQSAFLAKELSGLHAKLYEENGKYTLHVHDNLWYKFAA